MTNAYKTACSTVAKRNVLVHRIEAIAKTHGAKVEVSLSSYSPKAVTLDVVLGDHAVMITFDGASKVSAFLAHWYTKGDARYPANFGINCGGSVNTFHYGKATTCADNVDDFMMYIGDGLGRLVFMREMA